MQQDYDFEQLETARPHAGVARAYQPIGLPPPAKLQRKQALPASSDMAYWALACMWQPMPIGAIARCTGMTEADALAELEALRDVGKVVECGGLWDRVR